MKRTAVGELACFLILAALIYPLHVVSKSLGFGVYESKAFTAAFAIVFLSVFLLAYYWLEERRSRKRLENWENEFENLSLEEQAKCYKEKDTPFDRYIEERIKRGDFTREQWLEMKSAAHNPNYSAEIARQNREVSKQKSKRIMSMSIFLLIALAVFYIFLGVFS